MGLKSWKKRLEEAYARGYADGVKQSLEWTPASDPPKQPGDYLVLRANIDEGINHPKIRRTVREFDEENGWNERWMIGKEFVTHWRELPQIPEMDIKVTAEIR